MTAIGFLEAERSVDLTGVMVAMIDCEDWRQGSETPEGLNSKVREILGGAGGAVSVEQARALRDGMAIAKESLAAAHGQLSSTFAKYGEGLNSTYEGADVIQVASKITGVTEEDLAC